MITVVHDKHLPAVALNDDCRMVLGQRYFTGIAKPNYPMPAIPYEVQYNAASICIFHRSGPCERDVYILQTI